MRVLFTTTSGRGHFQPMYPLARALEHAGHEICWAAAEHVCATLRDNLLPIVHDWQPHLLVCEQAELAGPIAAAGRGIPNVTHAFGRLLPAPRVARARE